MRGRCSEAGAGGVVHAGQGCQIEEGISALQFARIVLYPDWNGKK